ncbi:MAG: hypothetical protein MJZ95_03100 [Paludibacteraceae bacterium]|nr:hypothetical protein [Paludibacteraceae bacterium]
MKRIGFVLVMVMVSSLAFCQSRKKQQAPVDNSYQVVNVTDEASICYDTTYKKYDLVCFVKINGENKTVQVNLGTDFDNVAKTLVESMGKYNVKRATVNAIMKYFIMYREMPVKGFKMTLDYCTDYALQLKIEYIDYEFEKGTVTFAINDPQAKVKLKAQIPFSAGQELSEKDLMLIKSLIDKEVIKSDAETDFFKKILEPEK